MVERILSIAIGSIFGAILASLILATAIDDALQPLIKATHCVQPTNKKE